MRQPLLEHHPEPATERVIRNPRVLWRRTSTSVVVLPPAGDPTELVGAAAAIWDAVGDDRSIDAPSHASTPDVAALEPLEIRQIVEAMLDLELVVSA